MRASCLHMNAFNLATLLDAGWEIPRGSLGHFKVINRTCRSVAMSARGRR